MTPSLPPNNITTTTAQQQQQQQQHRQHPYHHLLLLCHNCLTPSHLTTSCPYCTTSYYCSPSCQQDDIQNGHHLSYCQIVNLTKGSKVQIAEDDEEFVVYRHSSSSAAEEDGLVVAIPLDDEYGGDERRQEQKIRLSVGDVGYVVTSPDRIDAGGSLLLSVPNRRRRRSQMTNHYNESNNDNNNKKSECDDDDDDNNIIILCDALALEPPSPTNCASYNSREDVRRQSDLLWMRGARCWFRGDLREAMKWWEESLEVFRWDDDDEDDDEKGKGVVRLKPSPIPRLPLRMIVSRRCHFLGMCHNDLPSPSLSTTLRYFHRTLHTSLPSTPLGPSLFSEWALLHEERGELAACRSVARTARLRRQTPHWHCSSGYQRPGSVFFDHLDSVGVWREGREEGYPTSWTRSLLPYFDVVKEEFMSLFLSSSRDKAWHCVGGSHRPSGRHDASVLSSTADTSTGGDWREIILFGTGATPHVAPKTYNLLRKYCPSALSLADAGAGEVIFSLLAPRTRIKAHCAATNIRLTAHWGLLIPAGSRSDASRHSDEEEHDDKKCCMRVGEEWLTWKEAEWLVFDDSYEHEVRNDTEEWRGVLLIRFWHPMITDEMMREEVMTEVRRRRETEERRRFVPPMDDDVGGGREVERRGLRETFCRRCGVTGVVTVREEDGGFVCHCGEDIF